MVLFLLNNEWMQMTKILYSIFIIFMYTHFWYIYQGWGTFPLVFFEELIKTFIWILIWSSLMYGHLFFWVYEYIYKCFTQIDFNYIWNIPPLLVHVAIGFIVAYLWKKNKLLAFSCWVIVHLIYNSI